jgi:predicted signal transduction protein with EAL and GGDEF domain
VHVGASIGIAFADDPTEAPVALMRRADSAMYTAKQGGRGYAHIAQAASKTTSENAAA